MNQMNNLNYFISYLWVTYQWKTQTFPVTTARIFFNKWRFKGGGDDKLKESLFMHNDFIGCNYKGCAWD